jgi:hypothetical protein
MPETMALKTGDFWEANRMTRRSALAAFLGWTAAAVPAAGQPRRRPRGRVVRTRIVVHRLHPVRRPLPAMVVVRAPRTRVVVGAPLVFLPLVAAPAAVVALPARDRLRWEDSETIRREEEWVDCNFGVDARGKALYMDIAGAAQLNFAEVTFENGQVQVVDYQDRVRRSGVHQILDFVDGRRVMTVRVLAKADTDEARLTVYMAA